LIDNTFATTKILRCCIGSASARSANQVHHCRVMWSY